MIDDSNSEAEPPADGENYDSGRQRKSLDEIYRVLERGRRRVVLSHLIDCPSGAVHVEGLVDAVVAREDPDPGPGTHRTRVETELHHSHLPKLADADVIEYDPVAESVRYTASERLEELLEASIALDEEEGGDNRR